MNNFELKPAFSGFIPDWEKARHTIYPLLQANPKNEACVPALASNDILTGMMTTGIYMTLACFYQGSIILLTESLIRQWSISIAIIHSVMEENMEVFMNTSRFEEHGKDGFIYYTVHNALPYFNSLMPFYKPMQNQIQSFLGARFYFSIPERRTAVLFAENMLSSYRTKLRDDVLLTYECSAHALSKELIEVSKDGITPILDWTR